MFVILFILSRFNFVSIFMPFAFLTGGIFSGLSGYLGMKIATNSNSRTANACMKSLNSGLRVAFSSGSVMGLVVVGLALTDFSIWFGILNWYYGSMPINDRITIITTTAMDTQNPIFNPSHSHVPKRDIQILFQFILHLLTEALNSDEHKLFSSLLPACNE